jgi:hypothetical protein
MTRTIRIRCTFIVSHSQDNGYYVLSIECPKKSAMSGACNVAWAYSHAITFTLVTTYSTPSSPVTVSNLPHTTTPTLVSVVTGHQTLYRPELTIFRFVGHHATRHAADNCLFVNPISPDATNSVLAWRLAHVTTSECLSRHQKRHPDDCPSAAVVFA